MLCAILIDDDSLREAARSARLYNSKLGIIRAAALRLSRRIAIKCGCTRFKVVKGLRDAITLNPALIACCFCKPHTVWEASLFADVFVVCLTNQSMSYIELPFRVFTVDPARLYI